MLDVRASIKTALLREKFSSFPKILAHPRTPTANAFDWGGSAVWCLFGCGRKFGGSYYASLVDDMILLQKCFVLHNPRPQNTIANPLVPEEMGILDEKTRTHLRLKQAPVS